MIRSAGFPTLADFTEQTLLVPGLGSEFRDSAILELSQRLQRELRIRDATRFTHAVLDHESSGSAVVGDFAIPFARGPEVRKLSFALAVSKQGVRWGTEREPTVHVVALIAAPDLLDQGYTPLVATISNFLNDKAMLLKLKQCATATDIWELLNGIRCLLRCGG